MATDTATDVVKFHLSLNVSDLTRSIAFYRVLFDREAAKVRGDYAKFEVDEPPLIMSLIPTPQGLGGALNHIGVRLTDAATLVAIQARLEHAGYTTQREEGVECCYSHQTKFWVTDPDRTLWELYILHGDVDDEHETTIAPQKPVMTILPPGQMSRPAPVTWQHLLVQPLPERIELADNSVDEVLLQGTLNMQTPADRLQQFLVEVRRVLKPGGSVLSHALGASAPLADRPQLPGPAALVEHAPVESAAVGAFASAGFTNIEITKLGQKPCFTVGSVEMREMKLTGYKPTPSATEKDVTVIYLGPFQSLTLDAVNSFPCGQRVAVTRETAEVLQTGPYAKQFLVLGSSGCCDTSSGCCS